MKAALVASNRASPRTTSDTEDAAGCPPRLSSPTHHEPAGDPMTLTYDHLTEADLAAINQRQILADAALSGNLEPGWDDPERADEAVRTVVREDVPRLLLELEHRQVGFDEGYVCGLSKAVTWLRLVESNPDPDTMGRIISGAEAMVASAAERLSVESAR